MRRKKAIGDDNIPANLLKELGDNGLKIMTALYLYEWRLAKGFFRCYNDCIAKEKSRKEMQRP